MSSVSDARPGRTPDTLLILLAAALVAAAVVPFVPAGLFAPGQPVSLASFRWAESPALHVFGHGDLRGVVNVLFDGLTTGGRDSAAVGVVAFLLIVGGAFGVVQAGGAVDRGLARLVALTGDRPALLLTTLFIAFSLGGAVFGMGEETIAFLALLLPLIRRLGYPPETAVMATYVASQIGFGTSWMNPFSVAIAQGIAGVPLMSGAGLRIALWVTCTTIGIAFTLLYGRKRRRLPDEASESVVDSATLTAGDRVVLVGVLATVAWIVWGVTRGGYYIPEIASQFFALGVFEGAVAVVTRRLRANEAAAAFVGGVRQLVPAVLVIGFAKGIVGLLGGADPHQASALNTVLYSLGSSLRGLPPLPAAEGMLITQSLVNLVITSGSSQAAITMPLMAALGDLLGVTRQTAVLAFQIGDGFAHLMVPTSAAMTGAIGVAGIAWPQWIRAIWRLELLLLAAGALFVAVAVLTGYR